jgi:serine/threonine protein kinase
MLLINEENYMRFCKPLPEQAAKVVTSARVKKSRVNQYTILKQIGKVRCRDFLLHGARRPHELTAGCGHQGAFGEVKLVYNHKVRGRARSRCGTHTHAADAEVHALAQDYEYYAMKVMRKAELQRRRFLGRASAANDSWEDVKREISVRVPRCGLAARTRLRSGQIMKSLRHPNVVRLYEVIEDPQSDNVYLGTLRSPRERRWAVLALTRHAVMDYVEKGAVIPSGVFKTKPLGEELSWKYFRDFLAGLEFCASRQRP